MKAIPETKRIVRNIFDADFGVLIDENGRADGEILHANPDEKPGYGFHVYRMPAGHTTTSHVHAGAEEFLVLEGELTDHDGHTYVKGDLVWLEAGTEHNSYSKDGALLAVMFR